MIKGTELLKEQFYELNLLESKGNIIEEILANDLLTTVFQPIFSSKTGRVFGYEALTRLKNREHFDISRLFMLAIKNNCISKLELKTREIAIKTAIKMGLDFNRSYLFINLTPEILLDPSHSIGFTDKILEEYNIPKDKIVFEITEESSITNYTLFNQAINYYKNRGYKIAIDDFGTGYCGLKMLANIKPDFVKIDKYFISNIDIDLVKQNIVDSITIVSHRLGIRTIAERIETENEL